MGTADKALNIGSFEQMLLEAIFSLGSQAYGSKLQDRLSCDLGRDVTIGQLYLSLSKLEGRGLISYTMQNPNPVRGGRSKKLFRLETLGEKALERLALEGGW